MRARRWSSFVAGLLGGGALTLSMPSLASDPPAAAHGQPSGHDSHASSGGHQGQSGPAIAGPEIGFRGCAYFEDANFQGRRADVTEGTYVEWIGPQWNDRISSIACASGCRLIGYENINYGGSRRNFTGAVAEVGTAWNEKISSLRAVCLAESPHSNPEHAHQGPRDDH